MTVPLSSCSSLKIRLFASACHYCMLLNVWGKKFNLVCFDNLNKAVLFNIHIRYSRHVIQRLKDELESLEF